MVKQKNHAHLGRRRHSISLAAGMSGVGKQEKVQPETVALFLVNYTTLKTTLKHEKQRC